MSASAQPAFNALLRDEQLLAATRKNDIEAVTALLKQGARLKADDYRREVLQERERLLLVRPFVTFGGMSVDAHDNYENTALMLSAICNEPELARWLIDNGAGIDVMNRGRETPLSSAAMNGRFEIMRLLMDAGASLYKVYNATYKVLIGSNSDHNREEVAAVIQAELERRRGLEEQKAQRQEADRKAARLAVLRRRAVSLRPQ